MGHGAAALPENGRCGGGGYLWARRWVRDETWSMLAGCLYAFSGFSIYNIFFNHFLDVVALFPYMLAALDDAVIDDKKGVFPFWVALNLVDNYFFFAGQAVFLIIYFFCMAAGRRYELGLRKFVRLAWETALGCACGCVLLLPGGLSLLQIRAPSTVQRVRVSVLRQIPAVRRDFLQHPAHARRALFQGPVSGGHPQAHEPDGLSAAGRCRGRAGVLPRKGAPPVHLHFKGLRRLCVCAGAEQRVLCAQLELLRAVVLYADSGFVRCNVLSALPPGAGRAASAAALRLTTFLTLTAVVFAVVPGKDDDGNTVFGVLDEPARFWAIFGITMLGIVIFALLWHFCRHKRRWGAILTAAVLGFSLLYGSLHLSLTKYAQWDVDSNLIAETYDSVEDVAAALPDDAFYRIDAYGAHNNLGLWFNRSCLQFFNSTVAPSIMAFYPEVGVKRDVNSKPDAENYALRGLLSVRYTLVAKDKETEWTDKDLPGWQRTGETDAYALYENENWVPMGFTYDCYVTADQLERVSEEERAQILCRAILLDDDQISAFGSLLEPLPDEELTDRGEDAYAADCAARRAAGVAAFTATDTGFTAKTAYDADELVVFHVPMTTGSVPRATVTRRD